jgi:large subunit ribosomal protein L30
VSKLVIKQVRSANGSDKPQIATLTSLGLRKIGQQVEREDSPQLRGMIYRVAHLIEVEES